MTRLIAGLDVSLEHRPPFCVVWYTSRMTTITIPRKLAAAKDDLIVISRSEFESMKARMVPEYVPTAAARRSLVRARTRMYKNRVAGKLIPLNELKRDLARRG